MYIKMIGLYGIPTQTAYFRKQGDGCFDFVNSKKYASDLNEAECDKILAHADWYCDQYGADLLIRVSRT